MALQCGIHQLGSATAPDRGFNDCQRQCGDSQPVALDHVVRVEVTPPQPGFRPMSKSAVSWNGDLDRRRRELRQPVPPCRRHAARACLRAVGQHSDAYPSGVGESPIGDEVHAASAAQPTPRPNPAVDRNLAQPHTKRLGSGEYAVLSAQIVVGHSVWTRERARPVPFRATRGAAPALTAAKTPQIAQVRSRATPAERSSSAARPRIAVASCSRHAPTGSG